jgi:hypothetical protein
MAIGLIGMAAVVFYLGIEIISRAHAADTADVQLQQIAAALQKLSQGGLAWDVPGTVQSIGQLGDMMQQDPAAMQRIGAVLGQILSQVAQIQLAPSHSRPWGWGVSQRSGQPAVPPVPPPLGSTPPLLPQVAAPIMAAGQPAAESQDRARPITLGEVVQDIAILVTNVKEDSDWLRQHKKPGDEVATELAKMNFILSAIPTMAAEMHQMNIAMAAVPPMAVEMRKMNVSMGFMAQSVGSTMGRMGGLFPF